MSASGRPPYLCVRFRESTVRTDPYIWVPPLVRRVSRDRSLEEFLDGTPSDGADSGKSDGSGESDDSGDETLDASSDEGDAGDRADDVDAPIDHDPEEIAPIVPTYQWSEDGGPCGVCGERVRARWHSEDGFVCSDCKEW